MKTYTVKKLAQMAGVSIRTLHHYDNIGLLKPAFTGDNGYRHYGGEELLRLQQILIHREMDIPLSEIAQILAVPEYDRVVALRLQRERLGEQARRYAGMIRTIDRTIARLEGVEQMSDADLYSGVVSPEKQAEYEAWLERQGWSDASQSKGSESLSPRYASSAESMRELHEIEEGISNLLRQGESAHSAVLDPWLERHRAWVAKAWRRPCSPSAYAGLAEIYQHEGFRARYEAIEVGLTDYLVSAMKGWSERQV